MATPYNEPYKKKQRAANLAFKNRGRVLWVSCKLINAGTPREYKVPVKGTYVRALHGVL